jgi:hypothetical protein
MRPRPKLGCGAKERRRRRRIPGMLRCLLHVVTKLINFFVTWWYLD